MEHEKVREMEMDLSQMTENFEKSESIRKE